MTTSTELLTRLRELHPSLIDLSLGRTQRALEALERPQDRLPPTIHIAGTNGKGSVVGFLNAIFAACGKRAHSFISPHLVDFHERIRLATKDGALNISEKQLVDVLERAEAGNGGEPITFFEITMVAAFLAYADTPADYLILETGLGGRFDATNVIENPALSIITPISRDHTDFLGETIADIAFEKAGIMKPGVPCIIGPQQNAALEVLIERAEEIDAPLKIAGLDFKAYEQQGRLIYEESGRLLALPLPGLVGAHQMANAGSAIAAALSLENMKPSQKQLEKAMLEVSWPARLQRLDIEGYQKQMDINPSSEVWLDGGHNQAAAEVLAQTMADLEEQAPRPLHLIVGMMQRKDARSFLRVFEDICEMVFTVPVPSTEHGRDPNELVEIAGELSMRAEACEDFTDAMLSSAFRSNLLGDEPVRILICGSLYLAGHVLSLHEQDEFS